MEFFGLTSYGASSPIKNMMRPEYKEPEDPPKNLLEVEDKSGQRFSERMKELDCYIGLADGYAYKSIDRLIHMRAKSVIKPVGPHDMYKYPGTTSMDYGWWMNDENIKDEWHVPRKKWPLTTTEMSRYIEHSMKIKF